MTKDKFLKLYIEDMITYLNERLSKGKTVNNIREDLGIGEKKLRKVIKESGYKYNQKDKQYVLYNNSITKVISKDKTYNEVVESSVESNIEDESNTLVIPDNFTEQWNKFISFTNNWEAMEDDLKEVVKVYKKGYYESNTEVIEVIHQEGITIRDFKDDIKATTIKLHNESLQSWNIFCDKYKQYSKQDLVSMALEEYINKYDK